MKNSHLITIAQQFAINGSIREIEAFGSGLINDTYRIRVEGSPDNGFVLQKINHGIFKNVDALMENTRMVTDHLRRKIRENTENVGFQQVLKIIPTKEGAAYYLDGEGHYWRVSEFIRGSKSYDMVQTTGQAHAAGWAFGRFHLLLSDLDFHLIHEIIPDFHHIGKRLDRFEQAVSDDSEGRAGNFPVEINWIGQRKKQMLRILEMGESEKLPRRILHYDTKFNNVLLDDQDNILCIIDLDTVMPGYLAYDFGDAIRTIINNAPEDEAELDRITLNIPLFEAYTQGYFEGSADLMYQEEMESLLPGVLLLPYMQAVRFFTDYLEGDHYYKIQHPGHNLQRTRAQMKLVEELEASQELLENIIKRVASSLGNRKKNK